MTAEQSNEAYLNGARIYRCPNGCEYCELERGRANGTFMALMNAPPTYLRCGVCEFGETTGRANIRYNTPDAIDVWNATVFEALVAGSAMP